MTNSSSASDEPRIDRSRDHVLEERALARALELADDDATRARVQGLMARRVALMAARAVFNDEATRCRHARGEIYSAARVAALNAFGPSLKELEDNASKLYGRHAQSQEVLKTHARVHFVNVLMSARLNLAHFPADIRPAAQSMQAQEEDFARAWLDAIDDATFGAELRTAQRNALRALRTATRPMHLATRPHCAGLDEVDALALGKAWNKLDELAESLDVEPLSNFIAVPGEDDAAALPVARVVASIAALCVALRSAEHKLPGKKAVLASLEKSHAALLTLPAGDAGAWFEIDL